MIADALRAELVACARETSEAITAILTGDCLTCHGDERRAPAVRGQERALTGEAKSDRDAGERQVSGGIEYRSGDHTGRGLPARKVRQRKCDADPHKQLNSERQP